MSKQIKKLKDWFNQSIDEPEVKFDTKRVFPIRTKVGKVFCIIGFIFIIFWILIIGITPEESITVDKSITVITEYTPNKEPFRTISNWFAMAGLISLMLGLLSWFFSWNYIITNKKKEK